MIDDRIDVDCDPAHLTIITKAHDDMAEAGKEKDRPGSVELHPWTDDRLGLRAVFADEKRDDAPNIMLSPDDALALAGALERWAHRVLRRYERLVTKADQE